jgi:hypothetical protein
MFTEEFAVYAFKDIRARLRDAVTSASLVFYGWLPSSVLGWESDWSFCASG